jgi:prepilin-type N-terminal cleavage/methylation domain-containing protein
MPQAAPVYQLIHKNASVFTLTKVLALYFPFGYYDDMRLHTSKAFTLVELMIAIIIISILASVSTIGYMSIQRDTRDSARDNKAQILAEALEKYYDKNNEYPPVGALANQPITSVKDKLDIADTDILVFPNGTPGTNSIVGSNPSTTQIAYVGQPQVSFCNSLSSSYGYCDSFQLQYMTESGQTKTIDSRQTSIAVADCTSNCVGAPTRPTIVGKATGTSSVNFTASGSACANTGTLQYKIRYATGSPNFVDWEDASLSWQNASGGTATRSIGYPSSATTFYSQARARCYIDSSKISTDSADSNVHSFTTTPVCSAAPSVPSGLSLSFLPQGDGSQYKATLRWGSSSNSTACSTLRYVVSSNGYGSVPSNCITNNTGNICDPIQYIPQGVTPTYYVAAVNEYGTSATASVYAYAGPTVTSNNFSIYRNSNALFPLQVTNSATSNGTRSYLVAADYDTRGVCYVSLYTDAIGNGTGNCTGDGFGESGGNKCTTNRDFFIYDTTNKNFQSPHYTALGFSLPAPTVRFTSVTKLSNPNRITMSWTSEDHTVYTQIRYKVSGSGDWQGVENIAKDGSHTIGQSFSNGKSVEVRIYASNCRYKAIVSGVGAEPGYGLPNFDSSTKNF